MTTMSVDKGKGPIFDPGLCRCCGSMKRCRVLNEEYQCNGQKEVYSDIIIDCFGIMLSHLDAKPSSRLVCATCVSRLREAASFRAQVLRCEAAFLQLRRCDDEAEENQMRLEASAKLEVEIKLEPSEKRSVGSPAPDDLPYDPDDLPVDLGDMPDDPCDPTDDLNKLQQSTEPKPLKTESDSDDVPLRVRRRRTPKAVNGAPRAPCPPPAPGKDEPEERKMTPEEEAELKKHRANIKNILEFSNATPIRCFSGVGYKCCYCTDIHRDPKFLKIHTLTKHDVRCRRILMQRNYLSGFLVKLDITGLKCQLCDSDVIETLEELIEHLINKHKKKLHIEINSHILPFKFDNGLKCTICFKVFTKFRSLQEHMNLHFRNYICDVCETGYPTKKMLGQHFNMHKTGVFQCAYCPKTYNTNQKKQLHERHVHVSGSNFLNKCGVCQERFKSYRTKEQHMLESHGLSSAVKCQACDKTFKNQRLMTIHVQRDHLMRRPHKCSECDMSFYERQQLLNHLVKHTGVREFKCEVCLKSYGRKKTLREHMRIHEADRRFKCQYCGLGFVQKCSWRGHMRSKHSGVFVE